VIEDPSLDAFQTALIELMLGARTADDPIFDAHRAWIAAFDPALAEAMRRLVAHWSKRG
jgi:hypothetical protein